MRSKWILPLLVCAAVTAPIVSFVNVASATTLPRLSISNNSVVEGNTDTRSLTFDVTLSTPSTQTVSVDYSTVDDFGILPGLATGVTKSTIAGGDYVSKYNKTLTFNPGQVDKSFSIEAIGDTTAEATEQFSVSLSNPVGATISDGTGTGTIINDDPSSGFRLGIGDASIRVQNSGDVSVALAVSFSTPAPFDFSFTTTTHDGTAIGAAKANNPGNADYVTDVSTVNVHAGQTDKAVTIKILPKALPGSSKSFTVSLTTTLGGISRSTGTVVIRNYNGPAVNRAGRVPGPPRVALVGDSITGQYSYGVESALEAQGDAVVSHGISGSSILDASQCQNQLVNSVVGTEDPDIVIFENIGNYNLFPPCDSSIVQNSPEYFSEFQSVAQSQTNILTSNGAQVYWIVNPQVPSTGASATRYTSIAGINPIISNIAATTPNTFAIDAFTPFGGDPPDCSLRFSLDCVHLSTSGNSLMTSLITGAIQ